MFLFAATVATTWLAGGAAYSVAVMTILLCHEMGHYVLARRHGVDASLPFFIPLPFLSLFGTMGAVIVMRSRLSTREAVVDIGAAGPLAGALVAIPLTLWGLHLSTWVSPEIPRAVFGHGLWSAISQLVGRAPFRASHALIPVEYHSMLFALLAKIALPARPPGTEILLHPMAWAGWVGLFVTSLNLLPIGQLDGGHVAYALFGPRGHRLIGRAAITILIILSLVSFAGWLLWALIAWKLVGTRHPPIDAPERPLDLRRRLIGLASLVLLILTFLPNPLELG